jgi:alpha-1,6-mannosyltransferase
VRTYLSAKIAWLSHRADLRHVVVVPADRDERGSVARSTIYRVKGPPAPGSAGYHVLWNPARLTEVLATERPDVVELGSVYTAPWLLQWAARARHPKVIGFVHMDVLGAVERQFAGSPPAVSGIATRFTRRYLRSAYAGCDALVAASQAARETVLRSGLPEPSIVPMGVDLNRFRPDLRSERWRTEMGIRDDRPIGLYVGRLATEKELDMLISALPELHRRTGLTLITLGEGPLRPQLEALAGRQPELLRTRGFEVDRERLARAYASADVFLAPDSNETFGLAVLEAAACGLPVVGAASGAVGERLVGAPWGHTFEPGNPTSLVEATETVLSLDREAVGREARQTAEEYSWDRTFTHLLEVYRSVLS